MNFKRILRTVLCLVVVCCLVLNLSPLRAHATAAVAPVVSSVAVVTVPGALVVGATLIALGIYAGVETGAFESLANSAVDFLDTAGGWIKDGSMEVLKTVDSAGKATYYAANDLLETLRGWLVSDSGVVITPNASFITSGNYLHNGTLVSVSSTGPVFLFFGYNSYNGVAGCYAVAQSPVDLIGYSDGVPVFSTTISTHASGYYWGSFVEGSLSSADYVYPVISYQSSYAGGWRLYNDIAKTLRFAPSIANDCDLTLGKVSSVPIDGTSARNWSEEYADRRLYVVNNGGGSDPGNDDDGDHSGKWFWPLAGALTAGELYLLSQVDEWSAETPSEFPEGDSKTEFEILDRPEFEGLPGLEISPVQDPAPDTGGNTGGSTDATTGGETGSEGGSGKDYSSWLSRILTSIQEIPTKFQSWISDLKTAISELPSKFADWFQNLSQGLSNIWEELKTIPQKIADAVGQVLQRLFVPTEGFFQAKVDALAEKFPFVTSIAGIGTSLKGFFSGLGSKPPIIYIDLGAATSWYSMGGKTVFLDLTWYAQYKPTVDVILSAFLYLWLAWRVFLALPGILQGTSGFWGSPSGDGLPPQYVFQRQLGDGKDSKGD